MAAMVLLDNLDKWSACLTTQLTVSNLTMSAHDVIRYNLDVAGDANAGNGGSGAKDSDTGSDSESDEESGSGGSQGGSGTDLVNSIGPNNGNQLTF